MEGPAHFIVAAGVTNDSSIPKVKDDLRILVEFFTGKLDYQHALPELIHSPAVDVFRRWLSDWFAASERDPEDRIVLYFSGQGGIGKDGRHYLALVDSSRDRPSGTGFGTATLASIPFESGRVKQLLVVLDACFSGTGLADAASWASQVQADTGCLLQLISSVRKKHFAKDGVFRASFIEAISDQGDVLGRRVQEYLGVGPLVAEVNERLPEFQKATWGFAPSQTGHVLSPIRNPRGGTRGLLRALVSNTRSIIGVT